jgi:hypothetical protein
MKENKILQERIETEKKIIFRRGSSSKKETKKKFLMIRKETTDYRISGSREKEDHRETVNNYKCWVVK